jgi:hypothetical protein
MVPVGARGVSVVTGMFQSEWRGPVVAKESSQKKTPKTARKDSGRSASGQDPSKGDRVAWSSHGGEAVGRVEKKITERTEAAGRTVDASPEEPQYEVRSEKSGSTAVHKPSALRKKR